jgi:hypothetical protein
MAMSVHLITLPTASKALLGKSTNAPSKRRMAHSELYLDIDKNYSQLDYAKSVKKRHSPIALQWKVSVTALSGDSIIVSRILRKSFPPFKDRAHEACPHLI